MHREPDVGFDPGSPGSRPGPKAGAKPLRHPGIPFYLFFKKDFIYLFEREREREPERAQARGAAGKGKGRSRVSSEQGAQHRAQL